MQAAAQKYVDSSISKTINVPADFPFEQFKDVYLQAYELGCKGCTTYRPERGDRRGAGGDGRTTKRAARQTELPLPAPPPRAKDVYEAGGVVYMTQPLDRPEALPGHTYKIRWPESEHALYITINDIVQDGRRRPFEIFINSKNMEHYAWTVGLTRMISAVFRRGGDVSFVVEELKAVFDPRGGAWMGGRYVPSLLAAIGDVIERHMIDIGFLPPREQRLELASERQVVNLPDGEPPPGPMPQMRRGRPHPRRGLRPVHELRLFEVRVRRRRIDAVRPSTTLRSAQNEEKILPHLERSPKGVVEGRRAVPAHGKIHGACLRPKPRGCSAAAACAGSFAGSSSTSSQ